MLYKHSCIFVFKRTHWGMPTHAPPHTVSATSAASRMLMFDVIFMEEAQNWSCVGGSWTFTTADSEKNVQKAVCSHSIESGRIQVKLKTCYVEADLRFIASKSGSEGSVRRFTASGPALTSQCFYFQASHPETLVNRFDLKVCDESDHV